LLTSSKAVKTTKVQKVQQSSEIISAIVDTTPHLPVQTVAMVPTLQTQDLPMTANDLGQSEVKESSLVHVELFCVCQKPETMDMIACDACEQWFHASCFDIKLVSF
jgi:hypothetical protein